MSQPVAVHIERLSVDAIPECLQLAVDREWKAEAHKWQLIFESGEVWGTRDSDNTLVGTVAATRFGSVVAIGNVLVARRAEGRGLGRALMNHVLTHHDGAVFILNATSFGLPLYEKLGFEVVGSTHTHRGTFVPDAAEHGAHEVQVRSATPADLPAIIRLDAEVYGASRDGLMQQAFHHFVDAAFVSESSGRITGFAARWGNAGSAAEQRYEQVGPLYASTEPEARALISALGQGVEVTLRVDLNDRDAALRAWVAERGLAETSYSTLMVRSAEAFPGDRSRWYSALMQAVG